MLAPEAIAAMITAVAAAIAKDRDADELALLGAVFTQLGDTLATISAARDIEKNRREKQADDNAKKDG